MSDEQIYIAVAGTDDKKAEVYQFPDEKLVCVVPRIDISETGMIMAVKLVHHQPSNNVLVITGYEAGFTAVHLLPRNSTGTRKPTLGLAQNIYLSQPHTQPILSVDALPDGSTYFTSSADATIAAHRIPELPYTADVDCEPPENLVTNECNLDDDERHNAPLATDESTAHGKAALFTNASPEAATTSPDSSSPARNSDTESIEPLSFPKLRPRTGIEPPPDTAKPPARPSGLSSLLASAPPQPALTPTARPPPVTVQPAHKIINTKHAGQQSLRVRSDGRLLVTGGWDSKVRVYSSKTLKEVAVLKWHKEGVYAVSFGEVLGKEALEQHAAEQKAVEKGTEVAKRETGLAKLQRQREEALQLKHWVAAGAKDGKVSLWEVF
ncbi:Astra associated protein 1 Asa1 [Didymosphaeria variabile]|uniref:ASTRA-associated protein 1 n=1 Tax=Didymosphaeria variabile TaxID=1932322 RepID=A0A9W8XJY7_9PLEO|nr:Astra associated protein 1 Asa1 [Didymosphaeria variabile]KAJ4352327.1 Astra associated protein 1 Asa1 [Didymosphaeria variabile]